jgi:hypothetical protein
MMQATAGRSPARLSPKAITGFDSGMEHDSGSGPFASLSRIPAAPVIRRKCAACSQEDDSAMLVSPKLKVGAIDDPAEREADAIADRVMAGDAPASAASSPPPPTAPVARAKPAGGTMPVGGAAASAVGALGGGKPMPASDRAFFEPRLGQDLSHVRLHDDPGAEAAASSLGARAFTIGSDIVFGRGEYGTDHTARHLLAHELAHVQQNDGVVRMKCASPVTACDPKKEADRLAKVTAKASTFTNFEFRATTADCYDPAGMATEIKTTNAKLFTGNVANYKDEVVSLNDIKVKKVKGKPDQLIIGLGECFAFPVGWVDPKIGNVNDQLKSINDPKNKSEKVRVVSAIYGEQSLENEKQIATADKAYADHDAKYLAETDPAKKQELLRGFEALWHAQQVAYRFDIQRKYILYAMLLRIEGFEADWGPTFGDVATPGTFHSLKPTDGTHTNNFLPAKDYMEGKKPSKPVNKAAIDRLAAELAKIQRSSIPSDAGPYYFHWWEDSTAETKYQELLKAKVPKDQAERRAAYHHAKKRLGASLSGITETQGWLRKITGPNHGADNERIGSMYIFR